MAKVSSSALVVIVVAAAVLLACNGAHGAITTCGQATTPLRPCLNYLLAGGSVPAACCSGVRSLLGAARTTRDRRTVCSCMKSAFSGGLPGTVIGRAGGLPGQCRVSSPFMISPSTDCSRVT